MVKSCKHRFHTSNYLFGVVKLTKSADPGKYGYTGYGIGFKARSRFSLPDGSLGKNVIIFGADVSSSVHDDNKKKDILVLFEILTQGLDDTTVNPEAIYSINFTESGEKVCVKSAL